MLSLLENWKGKVEINGITYDSISDVSESVKNSLSGQIHIKLLAQAENSTQSHTEPTQGNDTEYRITVKSYMTKKATPTFDFMARWNNDNPMPLMTMTGTKEKNHLYMDIR